MKLLKIFFFNLILLFLAFKNCTNLRGKLLLERLEKNEEPIENDEEKPFLKKGWLKFFSYKILDQQIKTKIPSKFEYNPAYLRQLNDASKNCHKCVDQFGSFDIPSELSFFFVLTKKTLYVLSARRVLFLCFFVY